MLTSTIRKHSGSHKQRRIQRLQDSCCGEPERFTIESNSDAGNQFDGPFLAEIIEDLETDYILADGLIVQSEILRLSETWVLYQLSLITLAGKVELANLNQMCS